MGLSSSPLWPVILQLSEDGLPNTIRHNPKSILQFLLGFSVPNKKQIRSKFTLSSFKKKVAGARPASACKNKNHWNKKLLLINTIAFFFLQLHHPSPNATSWGHHSMDRISTWPAFLVRAPQRPNTAGKASMCKTSPVCYHIHKVWETQRHQGFEVSADEGWKDF